ncbi:lymphocyte antigen 75-like [Mugil cephalus]|uniref:lymphocyte antigen 75-like n=1 Tax=Mugil cephalus TaxID=48193 RepID=UPI001FB791BA|nr:lymphocyte antigen 75-like [Mugil cephalus]
MLWTLLFFCLIANCTTGKLIEGGKTTQSSTYTDHFSDKAVDGDYYHCAHTQNKSNSWWTMDLLGLYEISCININNTVAENIDLTNAQILIGNSSDGNFKHHNVCTTISDSTNGKNLTFQCDNGPMSGRYVTVHLERTYFVILCEVKIYGTKKDGLMLVQENRTWEEALYHCRDLNMDLVSILDEDTQGWVELEARKADSPYVWLGLHYNCTQKLFLWVDDHIATFERWGPGEKEIEDCDMSAVMDTTGNHYWWKKFDINLFNFICAE